MPKRRVESAYGGLYLKVPATAGTDALHSLDPQGHVDIAQVKKQYGDQVCLIGNVNCGMLTSGTEEDIIESARYCVQHGMPNGGYIFSTSNCAFTGLPLQRYELMWKTWHDEAIYPDAPSPQRRAKKRGLSQASGPQGSETWTVPVSLA